MVPSHDAHCIAPGGRYGCDGRPEDIFAGWLTYGIHISSHKCDPLVSEILIWKANRAATEGSIKRQSEGWFTDGELGLDSMPKKTKPDYKGCLGALRPRSCLGRGFGLIPHYGRLEPMAPLSHLQHLGSHSIVFDVRRFRDKVRPHRRPTGSVSDAFGGGHNLCGRVQFYWSVFKPT